MMNSVWQDTKLPQFKNLKSDISADVLIIGGGMAGILCAYMLKSAGIGCVLIEADRIFSGVSGYTTAKITSQHGLIYHKLVIKYGKEAARLYLDANEEAIKRFADMAKDIDCDFEYKSAFCYSTNSSSKLEKELSALKSIGFNAEYQKHLPLPFHTCGAVEFKNQAQFDPLKFIKHIVKELNIYENTKAISFDGFSTITNNGKITADKTIVATHFPILNKHGNYFLKMYQHRSYVLCLSGAKDVDGMYIDEDKKGLSFRNYKKYLLLGGGSHRTGKKGGNYSELEEFARAHYPTSTVNYRWATQDCMTLDGIPYIGKYSKNTTDFYVATGFNKWGMTSSMIAADIMTDLVQNKINKYTSVFSPSRSIIHPQLALNALEAVTNILTPTAPRCPHMGCALKWNNTEHTWDCPCHGSRFEKSGKLIENPATDDLKNNR